MKLAIIGVGNMGKAIAHALLERRIIRPQNLILSNLTKKGLRDFIRQGVRVTSDNKKPAHDADIIILAVKPQAMRGVLEEIKELITEDQLMISIAAGVEIKTIHALTGAKHGIIRAMPNLCATVGESVSVWVANKWVTGDQKKLARKILAGIGVEIEVSEEKLLDIVTAISGSGPAYIFYLVELLEEAGTRLGMSKALAAKLARQTMIGSAKLLEHSLQDAHTLRLSVTSKRGTTEAAIQAFKRTKLKKAFFAGVRAAFQKARRMRE